MNDISISRTPEDIQIEARHIEFEGIENKPRYWHGDNPILTHGLNAASMFFPQGEIFFIKSVQNFQNQIKDPKLREEINGFIAQEITHSQQHDLFNKDVYKQGYKDLQLMEKFVHYGLVVFHKYGPKKWQLALTVALEHITAIGANVLLQNPILMADVEPKYKELWYWHAVEESEHKAVAFDVFEEVSGSYFLRIMPLILMTITFVPAIGVLQLISLRRDKLPSEAKKMDKNKELLKAIRPALRKLGRDYLAYYRRDFHPWHLDNRDVIESWKKIYQETGKAAV